MAFLFGDGFDYYNNPALKWDVYFQGSNTTMTYSATGGRGGGGCISQGLWNPGLGMSGGYFQKNLGTKSTLFVGFAIKIDLTNWYSDAYLIKFGDSTSEQCSLRITSSGVLYFSRNGTTLGTASASIAGNVWNYVEISVVFATGTSGSATVKINGITTVISLSGINTSTTGNAYATLIQFGPSIVSSGSNNGNMVSAFWDDIYINDNSGSSFNTFLGDVSIRGDRPTGNGSLQDYTASFSTIARSTAYAVGATLLDSNSAVQRCTTNGTTSGSAPTWSTTNGGTTTDGSAVFTRQAASATAYLAINESPQDGAISTILDGTVGHQSTFTFPALTGVSGILGVVVNALAQKDAGGSRAIRAIAKSSATVADSGADLALVGSFFTTQGLIQNDPNTSSAWTQSSVNAGEFGVKTTV